MRPTFVLDGSIDGAIQSNQIISNRIENVPENIRQKYAPGVNRRTAFSVFSQGGVADRFFIDVDYKKDDRMTEADEDSKILLRYQGKKGELLKTLELGDTTLDLPGSKWLSLKGKTGKVSRESFAGKGVLSYKDIELTLLGSHQKGKPEREIFDLGSRVRRVEIRDTDFIQRTYYQIAPSGDLPVDKNSVVIYYDDGNGFNNNEKTLNFTPAGSTKEGSFDQLIPNDPNGYELDPKTGIIRFLFDLPYNGAVAVSYITSYGKSVVRTLIKADDDSVSTELKNYYRLPEDFQDADLLTVEDKSGRKLPVPSYTFDTVRNFLVFISTLPFPAEVYTYPQSNIQTIVLSYLSTGEKATVVLAKEPIIETVKVELNGRLVEEGTDYLISGGGGKGVITLYGTKLNDQVVVTYNSKDVPKVRQTVGGALVFGADKPISIALSGLYDFAPRPTRVPQLGNDTARVQMFGAALKAAESFSGNNIKLNIEAAGSKYDPNPYGSSMLDNMDATRRSFHVESREEFWKPSSKPTAAVGLRTSGLIEFGSVYIREIVPTNPSDRREQVMTFQSYPGEWYGVQRALAPSKGAVDLRPYRQIEMFVYSDGTGGRFYAEWGNVSEDSNGNARIDSEDSNRDGLVDSSEDTGLLLENSVVYGKENNLLDTEDIDRNGRLDTQESFIQDSVLMNWMGWKRVRFNLQNVNSCRYLRLWTSGGGKTSVAGIEFTGMEYKEEKSAGSNLTIGSVSNFSDPDAPNLLNHPTFLKLYPERDVQKTDKSEYERERQEDFALTLDYSVLAGGEVAARKDVQMDLTEQKEIHWFIASTAATNGVFFLRLGNQSDYYEYTIAVSQLSLNYKEYSIDKDRFKTVGTPDWQNIREIRVGVSNPGNSTQSGRLYFNDLFVDQPIILEAVAYSGEAELKRPMELHGDISSRLLGKSGNLFINAEVTQIPTDFSTADELLRGQERFMVRGGWESESASIEYSREENIEKEIMSQKGTYSRRLSRSFDRNDRVEWNLTPRVADWQFGIKGNFNKKEKRELNLREEVENSMARFELQNFQLKDWFPKKTWIEGMMKKELSLQRDTLGFSGEPKWIFWNDNLSLTPSIGFEETVQSSSSYVVAKQARTGLTGTARIQKASVNLSGTSENSMRRSDYPSFETRQNARGGSTYDGGMFGRTSIDTSLTEARVFTSSEALKDPEFVWQYQYEKPEFEAQSFSQVREGSAGQDNIRPFRIAKMNDLDYFGVGVRGKIKHERRRYMGTESREETICFPEGMVSFSKEQWYSSVGASIERSYGTDRQGRSETVPITLEYREKKWEIKNSATSKNEMQERFGERVMETRSWGYKLSGKCTLGSPIVQSVGLIRRNIYLYNQLDLNLSCEIETKEGTKDQNKIEEMTIRATERTDYYFREGFKAYVLVDLWKFSNRIASSADYMAYSITAGVNAKF